jgi:predicted transcriptional regulator
MENEIVPATKRRLAARGKVLRRARIFARLREGWAYDEIAEDEGVTAERIRQIVREALAKRLLDEETDHAKLQLARLQPAMRIASEAVADGLFSAINPLLKVLDRLDRYQRTAKVNQVYDDDARQRLLDRQKKNALGGRRKPLKKLDSDKEIKVNAPAFLWPGFAGFGQIWLNLARFGLGLDASRHKV